MTSDKNTELNKVSKEFSAAVKDFRKKDYKKSLESFNTIIGKYENSESQSILDIQRKAVSYANICTDQLSTQKSKTKTDDDQLNEIVYFLNNNNLKEAEKTIFSLAKKKSNTPFFLYLQSLLHLKKEEIDTSLDLLEKCVKKDSNFKVLAYNEPDFEKMFENERFNSIVE